MSNNDVARSILDNVAYMPAARGAGLRRRARHRHQAWSPIGGITFYRDSGHTSTLDDPIIRAIADAHGRTPAQVLLRWGLQQGRSVIPKSTNATRIAQNIDVFDFELSVDDLTAIDGLETGHRGGPEPDVVTLETFARAIPEADEA